MPGVQPVAGLGPLRAGPRPSPGTGAGRGPGGPPRGRLSAAAGSAPRGREPGRGRGAGGRQGGKEGGSAAPSPAQLSPAQPSRAQQVGARGGPARRGARAAAPPRGSVAGRAPPSPSPGRFPGAFRRAGPGFPGLPGWAWPGAVWPRGLGVSPSRWGSRGGPCALRSVAAPPGVLSREMELTVRKKKPLPWNRNVGFCLPELHRARSGWSVPGAWTGSGVSISCVSSELETCAGGNPAGRASGSGACWLSEKRGAEACGQGPAVRTPVPVPQNLLRTPRPRERHPVRGAISGAAYLHATQSRTRAGDLGKALPAGDLRPSPLKLLP